MPSTALDTLRHRNASGRASALAETYKVVPEEIERQEGKPLSLFYEDTVLGTYFTFILQDVISSHLETVVPITIANICVLPWGLPSPLCKAVCDAFSSF